MALVYLQVFISGSWYLCVRDVFFAFVELHLVSSVLAERLAVKACLKRTIMCRLGCKTLTWPVNHLDYCAELSLVMFVCDYSTYTFEFIGNL